MDIAKAIENLKAHGFEVSFFETGAEAAEYIDGKVDGKSIGFGGSVTLRQLGLFRMLQRHNDVVDRTVVKDEKAAFLHDRDAQVYISSCNGISEDGRLVNIDGIGNRIANTLWGKEEVYFIVGINKFADTLEDAVWRARNIAAPKNAQRLGRKTPCAVRGDRCYDCSAPERLCRGITIIERPLRGVGRYEIVIVNKELGY